MLIYMGNWIRKQNDFLLVKNIYLNGNDKGFAEGRSPLQSLDFDKIQFHLEKD